MINGSSPRSNGIRGGQQRTSVVGMNSNKGIILAWLAVALMMGLIFFLSAQTADQSVQLSGGVTQFLLTLVGWIFPNIASDPEIFHHLVRKSAHFLAYLLLGTLTANACRRSGASVMRTMLLALIICVFYAASDEIHQLYVSGRGAAVTDVLIDSAGALLGIFLHRIAVKGYQNE